MSVNDYAEFTAEADFTDEAVLKRLAKNERIADRAMNLIIKRTSKKVRTDKQAHDSYEDVLNILGMMCAEMIRDPVAIDGMAEISAYIFRMHIDRALVLSDVSGSC